MLLTPQLEPFFPDSCNLNLFSLKPQTLCVWGGANSATWPSTYIYIYIELLLPWVNFFSVESKQ